MYSANYARLPRWVIPEMWSKISRPTILRGRADYIGPKPGHPIREWPAVCRESFSSICSVGKSPSPCACVRAFSFTCYNVSDFWFKDSLLVIQSIHFDLPNSYFHPIPSHLRQHHPPVPLHQLCHQPSALCLSSREFPCRIQVVALPGSKVCLLICFASRDISERTLWRTASLSLPDEIRTSTTRSTYYRNSSKYAK